MNGINLKSLYFDFFFKDYKTYLDFVLALENKKEPQALHYLFKILDVQVFMTHHAFSIFQCLKNSLLTCFGTLVCNIFCHGICT